MNKVYKLTKDKLIIEDSYIVLTSLLIIQLDNEGKVSEVRTVHTSNEEFLIVEASDEIKALPNRDSKELEKSEFDELVEIYKNNIKDIQS